MIDMEKIMASEEPFEEFFRQANNENSCSNKEYKRNISGCLKKLHKKKKSKNKMSKQSRKKNRRK